jgi:L-serine dehydratase
MRFVATDEASQETCERVYYSIGGGFVIDVDGVPVGSSCDPHVDIPYPFDNAEQLIAICRAEQWRVSDLMLANERAWRDESEIWTGLRRIWQVMRDAVTQGCHHDGILPGGLGVHRRASEIMRQLQQRPAPTCVDAWEMLDWVDLFALAVNEENAAGGRVVTAPTNGAAGVIPAVMHFLERFMPQAREATLLRFLLTAGAIGILYKKNASISAAEVGCQGEIGVACSMAAGALVEALGGSLAQVEQAAEIGMEHHLGLTCDPVGGLVQIPCIERNAMGAVQAIHAARIALRGDGTHRVSLDRVIATMRQTGADMSVKYKETSEGGLAVNVPLC